MAKILVVDDDPTVTQLLKMLLSMEGHQTMVINDSNETLEVANQLHPDLITLDLMMPGLTGFELCELLHNDPRFANIPIEPGVWPASGTSTMLPSPNRSRLLSKFS